MSKKRKRQIDLCSSSENQQKEPLKVGDFLLTSDQRLVIMSKLPKLFSLQPVKNFQKKNKELQTGSITKDKSIGFERINPSRMLYKKQRQLIEYNQKQKKEQKSELRKLQTISVKDESLFDEQEYFLKEYHNISSDKNSEKIHTDLDDSFNPTHYNSQVPISQMKNDRKDKSKANKQDLSIQSLSNIQKFKEQNESSVKSSQQKDQGQLNFEKQWQILNSLKKHSLVKPFLFPVDEILDKAKDYYKIIKQPIDLSTIESKLKENIYKDPLQFHMDIQRMWMNSFQYNRPMSGMAKITKELKRFYLNILRVGPPKSLGQKQNKKKRR